MIKTFLVIIIIVLLSFFIFNNHEKFVEVIMNNDFYLNSNSIKNLNDLSINTRKLCIFKRDSSKKKIIDYECIDANQLMSTLKLPENRKKIVCVDGNCLDTYDLKILNGTDAFKLKNASENDNFKDKCVGGNTHVKLKRCGDANLPEKWFNSYITSFGSIDCNSSQAWPYKFNIGNNLDKNLSRNRQIVKQDAVSSGPPIRYLEGH